MRPKYSTIFIIILIIGLIRCSNTRFDNGFPESRSLGEEIPSYRPPYEPTLSSDQLENPTGVITLPQTLALALMKNPNLRAFSWEVRAREAKILQAGLYPNPELGVDAEDIFGSNELKGFDGSQITIWVSQPIKLGGQLSKGERVMTLERDLAGWDYEAKRIDVFTKVTKAFVNVLTTQKRLQLTKSMIRLSKKVYKTVSARVKAGKVSPIEKRKAKISLSFSLIELQRVKLHLEENRRQLSATWGGTLPIFKKASGELNIIKPIPSAEELVYSIKDNPKIARWAVEMEHRKASVTLEEAKKIPDLTVSGGFRFFNETGNKAFTLGLSMLLPVFDRNQGNILESKYRLAKAEEEKRAMSIRVLIALTRAYQILATSHTEVTTLKNDILPEAQKVFHATREGYRQGKFNLLELLDAQRVFFKARGQYLNALSDYHKAIADVESLIGTRISSLGDRTSSSSEGQGRP